MTTEEENDEDGALYVDEDGALYVEDCDGRTDGRDGLETARLLEYLMSGAPVLVVGPDSLPLQAWDELPEKPELSLLEEIVFLEFVAAAGSQEI